MLSHLSDEMRQMQCQSELQMLKLTLSIIVLPFCTYIKCTDFTKLNENNPYVLLKF